MNKIIKTVQITEAGLNLSELLELVEQDKAVVRIQREGQTAAVLVPYDVFEKRRDAAIARMSEILDKGFHLGNEPFDRDEAHERS